MTSTKYSPSSIHAIVGALDARTVFHSLGIGDEHITESDSSIKTHCPVHGDLSSYSLVYEKNSHSVYCLDLQCRVSRLNAGELNLISFYALATNTTFDHALEEWAGRLGIVLDKRALGPGTEEKGAEAFTYVEVGRFAVVPKDDIIPPPQTISFDGREYNRSIMIPAARVSEFRDRNRVDLFMSRFLYDTDDPEVIRLAEASDELALLGNYFLVFEAQSSAEIVHAINQAIEVVEILRTRYDVPIDAIDIYYSGRKIEIEVDFSVFGVTPRVNLHVYYRRMTRVILGLSSDEMTHPPFTQLNMDVYTPDSHTIVPGSALSDSKGIYKIKLSYNLFKKTNYVALFELSQKKPDIHDRALYPQAVEKARALFDKVCREVEEAADGGGRDAVRSIFYDEAAPVEGLSSVHHFAPDLFKRIFAPERSFVPSPSAHLNYVLGGGYQPGNVYMIAGFPGSGTSTFALWTVNHAAEKHRIPCLYVTLQLGIEEIFKRSLSAIGSIPSREINSKRLSPNALVEDESFRHRIFAAYEKFQAFNDLITVVEGSRGTNVDSVRQLITNMQAQSKAQGNGRTVFVVLDSLQLMLANVRAQNPGVTYDLNTLTSRVKSLARELDVIVLTTSEYYAAYDDMTERETLSNPIVQQFYQETQFADTVGIVYGLGCSLKLMKDFFRATYPEPFRKEYLERIVGNLSRLEKEAAAKCTEGDCSIAFTMLDIIKNRGGIHSKVLFQFEKAISTFRPVDFLDLPEHRDIL
jgi:replicative DNA helicase